MSDRKRMRRSSGYEDAEKSIDWAKEYFKKDEELQAANEKLHAVHEKLNQALRQNADIAVANKEFEKICMLDSPIYDNPDTRGKGLAEEIWYHGMITRLMSEKMLRDDGDFLVRDSISNPGDYVLTVMWRKRSLHFQINVSIEEGKKMFHFEEELFTTLVDLICFYQNHKRPITLTSGCIIINPVGKREDVIPLEIGKEIEASYMHIFRPMQTNGTPRSLSQQVLLNQANIRQNIARQQRPLSSISLNQSFAIPDRIPPPPAALINRPLPLPIGRMRRSSEEDYSEVDYDAMEDILDASSVSGINFSERERSVSSPSSSMSRKFQSCQNLTYRTPSPALLNKQNPITRQKPALPPRPKFKSEKSHSVPPTPSMKISSHQPMSVEEARDSAFVDYDEPKVKLVDDDYDKLSSRPTSSEYDDLPHSLNVRSDYDSLSLKDRASRQRDSGIYSSPSPPSEHISYSKVHLNQLKLFILNKSSDEIAEAITYEDVKILRFLDTSEESAIAANNGLRCMLLPNGASLRHELVERCHLIQLSCILSIVSCGHSEDPFILRQWIFTASSLILSHGNVFGFVNVFNGLNCKYLQTQQSMWDSLDIQSKIEFESLKGIYISLKNGSGLKNNNIITIPFLQPILEILSGFESQYLDETSYSTEIDSVWLWLDSARNWTAQADQLRKVASLKYRTSPMSSCENSVGSQCLSRLILGSQKDFDRCETIIATIQKITEDFSV